MWLALLACQAPFGTDRHDLVGFRVAAIAVAPTAIGEYLAPRVAIVVDGRPWSDDAVTLLWYWVDSPEQVLAIDPITPYVAFGPAPLLTVPSDQDTLALIAIHGDDEQRSFVEIAPPPATLATTFGVGREALPLTVESAEGPDLLLDARAGVPSAPLGDVDPGDFVRLTADVPAEARLRWMATAGTFFELAANVADWAAGEVKLDGDQIEERSVAPPGGVTFVALALGIPGEARFHPFDLTIGPRGDGVVLHDRIVPTEPALAAEAGDGVRGTIALDDSSPTGIRLVDAEIVDPALAEYGSLDLPCASALLGPFDPSVLLNAVCTRADIDGIEVVGLAEGAW